MIDVIAGQGTVALELIEQMTPQDYVFIPCGGGGLLAGMAVVLKHHWPDTIIGVEPSDAACALAARKAGSRVTLSELVCLPMAVPSLVLEKKRTG